MKDRKADLIEAVRGMFQMHSGGRNQILRIQGLTRWRRHGGSECSSSFNGCGEDRRHWCGSRGTESSVLIDFKYVSQGN